jgi:hypothetical protein
MPPDLDAFKIWLSGCGGEVLGPVNEWEVIRVRTSVGILVAHRTRRGRQIWPAALLALAHQFERGEIPALAATRRGRTPSRLRQRFAALAARDGAGCFFCGHAVPAPGVTCDPDMSPTIEHLVPVAYGGPNHLSNCFLAHRSCNAAAGTLSAAEKVRLRDAMRTERRVSA